MYNKEEVLKKVDILYNMWKEGSLGGEVMPEDANPHLDKSSVENYLYFTLPMALNYQRNSYKLWESALNTYNDKETNFVFDPKICIKKTFEEVQYALVKYKIALQKQKQTEIWLSLCKTFTELYDGDIRELFESLDNDVINLLIYTLHYGYGVEMVLRRSNKMKVLFATTNPAKIKKYAEKLKENNIDVLTIKDLGINLKPEETGKNAIENAYIKAKAYYDKTKITTIGMDNNLYIEELPEEKQPGTHVRRVNGKELNDDEMLEYYCNLVKEYGGKLTAKWVYGMVIYDGKEPKEYSWSKSHFYFVDKPCEKRNPGYPLDSMSIMPECNKYFVDLTEEDRNKNKENYKEDDVINFIVNNCWK